MQLLFASPANAQDHCAAFNGSSWKDAAGHPILVTAITISFINLPDHYQNMPYTCSNNTIIFTRFHEWSATIAEDGMTAEFRAPDGKNVWQLVSWPTDCNLGGQWLATEKSVTAFQRPTVVVGQKCVAESRTCNNGTLSGSFLFPNCVVQSRQMTPATAAGLVVSVVLIGLLVRRLLGRLS